MKFYQILSFFHFHFHFYSKLFLIIFVFPPHTIQNPSQDKLEIEVVKDVEKDIEKEEEAGQEKVRGPHDWNWLSKHIVNKKQNQVC